MTTIKKSQNGSKMSNPKGYAPKTSPLPNIVNKGKYEKKLDTVSSGSIKSVRLLDGKGKVLNQERLGSSKEKAQNKSFNKTKAYTNNRRMENSRFLESRQNSGKLATEYKAGGTIKKKK